MMQINTLVLLLLIVCSMAQGQELVKDEVSVVYNNQIEFGLDILTTGFGLEVRRGKKITVSKRSFWEVNLKSYKDPKEIKTNSDFSVTSNFKSYSYGKLNSIHQLRLGYGREWTLASKENKENVSVNYILSGGLSTAFLKPYYLLVTQSITNIDGQIFAVSTYEQFDFGAHGLGNIIERAPYRVGFGEMKLVPGAYVSTGLKFDYGNEFDLLRGIEAGLSLDAYPSGLPILSQHPKEVLLFNIYLRFTYGRKW
jgi:hypothetical protein